MAQSRLIRRVFKAMGSPCEIQVFAETGAAAAQPIAAAIAEVARLEARYSRYREDSFLSAINAQAALGGAIEVDGEIAHLLDYIEACFIESGGLFDVTSGVLRNAWRFHEQRAPEAQEVEALLDRVGWRRLQWTAPILSFSMPGMELDFGGVVKEYAADRAAATCREAGAEHGMVNLGGDIRVIGPRADGAPWRIGIRHPRDPTELTRSVELRAGALTTSGDYERCIKIDGVRYGHILNPLTGWPIRRLASVSVVADLAIVAGSAATIAMLKEDEGPAWLRQLGLPHLWIDVDGATGGSLAAVARI